MNFENSAPAPDFQPDPADYSDFYGTMLHLPDRRCGSRQLYASAVCRRLASDRSAVVELMAGHDGWLSQLPPVEQVIGAYAQMLAAELQDATEAFPEFGADLDRWEEFDERLRSKLAQHPASSAATHLVMLMSVLVLQDEYPDITPDSLRELIEQFDVMREAFGAHLALSQLWTASFAHYMSVTLEDLGFSEATSRIIYGFADIFQRLWWLVDCRRNRGVVLSGSYAPALPSDPDEAASLLLRMAANQPLLMAAPALARHIPLRADAWLPVGERALAAFAEQGRYRDLDLAKSLAGDILERRRYLVDHIAHIELDELGIQTLTAAPEFSGARQQALICLVHHEAGLYATCSLVYYADLEDRQPSSYSMTFPANALTQTVGLDAGDELTQLLILGAWRDLVVPDVREQQYQSETMREGKAKTRSRRAAKRGSVSVVRYLPRRLAARRAEVQARASGDGATLRRLYPVGTYAKLLPAGHRRSSDADLYAKEIGMPLSEHQTVVRPHWRGATEDERNAAAISEQIDVRTWRSWSALDLLRTRGARRQAA